MSRALLVPQVFQAKVEDGLLQFVNAPLRDVEKTRAQIEHVVRSLVYRAEEALYGPGTMYAGVLKILGPHPLFAEVKDNDLVEYDRIDYWVRFEMHSRNTVLQCSFVNLRRSHLR